MERALAHWLNTMHPTPGNTASDRLEDAARAVEPKDTWTPVSADEAERVVRALVGEASVDGTRATASEGPGAESPLRGRARKRAALAAGALTFLVAAVVILALISRNPAQSGHATASLAGQAPPHGHPSSSSEAAHNSIQEQEQEMNRATVAAAVAGVIVAGESFAQSAVQWRVEDGGNGHWYQSRIRPNGIDWLTARAEAEQSGGHLATLTSLPENDLAFDLLPPFSDWPNSYGPWIGGYRVAGGWAWVTNESFSWTHWRSGEPNNDSCSNLAEDAIQMNTFSSGWNDFPPVPSGCDLDSNGIAVWSYVIEWSADCNADGIVDYGQCRNGSLADFDGNNVPDCCERGEPCLGDRYPVRWRVEDGGNGHWYQLVFDGHPSWTEAKQIAEKMGGHLATLTSQGENDLGGMLSRGAPAMLLGGYQDRMSPDYSEPAGGWRWITGEPWTFTNWGSGEPNDAYNGHGDPGEDYLSSWTGVQGFRWGDGDNICPECNPGPLLVEWSADCNSDGIVDYGQILAGDLADANSNGIPDVCEVPSCIDADLNPNGIVDGADLGAMLAFWGPVSPAFPRADINGDGNVNGADLGILLSLWGPCGG